MANDELLDLKESKLILEGTPEDHKKWNSKINNAIDNLKQDLGKRKQVYTKRKDFYTGNQGDYSNVVGVLKDSKQKKGHTNQVTNYAGKTTVKIAFGLANNPPNLSTTPEDITDDNEEIKAQAVEDYIDSVLKDRQNKFFKNTYRRACFVQAEFGDVALKTCVVDGKIKIIGHDDMGTLMVGWNGNPGEYDFVIAENQLTPQNIQDEYGIKVNEKKLEKVDTKNGEGSGSWYATSDTWGMKSTGQPGKDNLPTGKTKLPTLKVIEYDSLNVYAIQIEGELVQLVFKDDENFPKIKLWTIVHNVPNPPSPWSIADIDYLMDAQIELNDNDNRSADHLRVGNVQRYVAYNMSDFDPTSIKTTSGQVIFVNDPDGKSKFEPLPTNINNFPDDQYHTRKMSQMYDMGLPKVNYGASGADSGRSKAIDYQSSIDLTAFKRDAWELALQDICEKIQILGNFLHGSEVDWFTNDKGEFITRNVEFDWTDILPVSQSDKIVNVANKVNMIGLPLDEAFKELGYRNPQAIIEKLKKELADPNLMILRSKMWPLSQGILEAQNAAAVAAQSNMSEMPPPAGSSPSPMLTSGSNQETKQPMANATGNTAVSSASGVLAAANQNMKARTG